jgi:hypothetical protein
MVPLREIFEGHMDFPKSEQSDDFSFAHVQADTVQGVGLAIEGVQILDLQQCGTGGRSLRHVPPPYKLP